MKASQRTVLFVQEDPFPPQGGSTLRDWQNISACAQLGPVLVICTAPGERRTARLDERITVMYFGDGRARLLPDTIVSKLGRIPRRAYNRISRTLGERALCRLIRPAVAAFDPTVAVFEEYKTAAFSVCVDRTRTAVVYDAHNIEAVLQRELLADRPIAFKWIELLGQEIVSRERTLAAVADQIWVCSEADRSLALEHFPRAHDIRIVPNTIDVSQYDSAYSKRHEAAGDGLTLIFCASFDYPPNQEAARILVGDIFPRVVGRIPNARLILAGRDPTAEMVAAARADPRIVVTGRMRHAVDFLGQSQVCLVPLQSGSGTRLKVLEAFASGCAVISTRKGAEGLSVTDGEHLLFAETPEEFASATAHLWVDASLRQRLIRQARALVTARYSSEAARCAVEDAIINVVQTRNSPSSRHTSDRWMGRAGLARRSRHRSQLR
ncbi:MAG TPA: glycosyltransferase family 4 protein [Alphaproteobacteria bacterium]